MLAEFLDTIRLFDGRRTLTPSRRPILFSLFELRYGLDNSIGCFNSWRHFTTQFQNPFHVSLYKQFHLLYYYVTNFCKLSGLEQWYFSLI